MAITPATEGFSEFLRAGVPGIGLTVGRHSIKGSSPLRAPAVRRCRAIIRPCCSRARADHQGRRGSDDCDVVNSAPKGHDWRVAAPLRERWFQILGLNVRFGRRSMMWRGVAAVGRTSSVAALFCVMAVPH